MCVCVCIYIYTKSLWCTSETNTHCKSAILQCKIKITLKN